MTTDKREGILAWQNPVYMRGQKLVLKPWTPKLRAIVNSRGRHSQFLRTPLLPFTSSFTGTNGIIGGFQNVPWTILTPFHLLLSSRQL